MKKLQCLYRSFGCISPLWMVLIRLTIAIVFVQTGYGKLTHIPEVTAFFESLHIPMAHAQAVFVSWLELIGGIAIALGLCTRLFSFLLIGVMSVAILTAQVPQMQFVLDLFGFQEWNYILLFGLLLFNGPGKYAVDTILCKRSCTASNCCCEAGKCECKVAD